MEEKVTPAQQLLAALREAKESFESMANLTDDPAIKMLSVALGKLTHALSLSAAYDGHLFLGLVNEIRRASARPDVETPPPDAQSS